LSVSTRTIVSLALLAGALPAGLRAQAVLNQFSYDNLRPSALQVDVGLLGANRLSGTVVGGLRLDYGFIAPKVRVLLGLSYYRAQLNGDARDRFVERLRALIDDPTNDYTIDIGRIYWGDIVADMDFQYMIPQGAKVTTYLGVGLGVHLRNGSGPAINGTFVEDALDEISAAGNVSLEIEVRLAPAVRWTIDTRGVVSTGLSTVSLRTGLMLRWAQSK
jgi:hypothetical protein